MRSSTFDLNEGVKSGQIISKNFVDSIINVPQIGFVTYSPKKLSFLEIKYTNALINND